MDAISILTAISMEYQGSNPNVDYYPGFKHRNKIVFLEENIRSFTWQVWTVFANEVN